MLFTRFACVAILHFGCAQETYSSLQLLKYNCLHIKEFDKCYLPAFAMCLQFVKTVWVEINGTIFTLCSSTVTDVVGNFLVIEIISQFDDFVLLPVIKNRHAKLCELEF